MLGGRPWCLRCCRDCTKRYPPTQVADVLARRLLASILNSGGDFRTFHLVPGIEYAISDNLDLLVEVGIGLNESASHYVSGGVAFYIR